MNNAINEHLYNDWQNTDNYLKVLCYHFNNKHLYWKLCSVTRIWNNQITACLMIEDKINDSKLEREIDIDPVKFVSFSEVKKEVRYNLVEPLLKAKGFELVGQFIERIEDVPKTK